MATIEPETLETERKLKELYSNVKQYSTAVDTYKQKIATTTETIKSLEKVIREKHVEFSRVNPDKKNGILEGSRCFICGNTASVCCFWCVLSNTPASYCPNHRERHKQEHPDHTALFRYVSFAKAVRHVTPNRRIPLTPEQELQELQARIAELKAQGVTV